MNNPPVTHRLAVCSWSLQPQDPDDLVAKLAACGICRVQLALDPLRQAPDAWRQIETILHRRKVAVVSGMFGCVGEDYTTPQSIRLTGGIAPDSTWEHNRKTIKETVALAARMGLNLVTFHAGFVPERVTDPKYAVLLRRLGEVAEMFAGADIALGLETGQETAPALAELLRRLCCPNLGVNFDPANMILYNQGDPVEALRVLAPWIRQVHIKDAIRPKVAGEWGEEVAVGQGEVDWPAFLAALRQVNYAGDFVIEREAGSRRIPDIVAAKGLVSKTI